MPEGYRSFDQNEQPTPREVGVTTADAVKRANVNPLGIAPEAAARVAAKRGMVLCFVFVHSHPDSGKEPMVILVRKREPEWQRGKWNGAGGEIEPGEGFFDAACREVYEELGLKLTRDDWKHVASLTGKTFTVEVVAYHVPQGGIGPFAPMFESDVRTDGKPPSEFFQYFTASELPDDVVPDVRWLVPLCLDGRFWAPVFFLKPEFEYDPNKPVAAVVGGKETNRSVLTPADHAAIASKLKELATGNPAANLRSPNVPDDTLPGPGRDDGPQTGGTVLPHS